MKTNVNTTGAGSAHAEKLLKAHKDDAILAAEVCMDLAALADSIRRCGADTHRAERLAEIARRIANEFCASFEQSTRDIDAQLAEMVAPAEEA